jgi:hypothetical protein
MTVATTRPLALDDVPVVTVLIPHHRVPLLVPARAMSCRRCGTTYAPAEDQQDRAILLAACCPRCDGQLTPSEAAHLTR